MCLLSSLLSAEIGVSKIIYTVKCLSSFSVIHTGLPENTILLFVSFYLAIFLPELIHYVPAISQYNLSLFPKQDSVDFFVGGGGAFTINCFVKLNSVSFSVFEILSSRNPLPMFFSPNILKFTAFR